MKQNPKTREEVIEKYVRGKKVLDIGCVSNQVRGHYRFGSLHKYLAEKASEIVGMDINKEGVRDLKKQGFSVILGNAETFELNEKFDVIVAGELIEHLNNQGLFLENVKKHLRMGGRLILTTPNAFAAKRLIWAIGKGVPVNEEHTLWHDVKTLKQVVKRCGYEIEDFAYVYIKSQTLKSKFERFLCFKRSLRPRMVLIARKK